MDSSRIADLNYVPLSIPSGRLSLIGFSGVGG
jgi:hypothetical protein